MTDEPVSGADGAADQGGRDSTGAARDTTGAADATPDAVEQLQRAVLTAIGATRVVLDALEAVVADRRRLDQLSATGRDALGTLCGALFGDRRPAPPPDGGPEPPQDRAAKA